MLIIIFYFKKNTAKGKGKKKEVKDANYVFKKLIFFVKI
jgi:hypothetical protein